MAKANVSQATFTDRGNGLTVNPDGSVSLSALRSRLCLEATWEIESLALALPDLVPNTEENNAARHLVRGIAARIFELNAALMGGLNDELETVKSIHRAVTLKYPEAEEAA